MNAVAPFPETMRSLPQAIDAEQAVLGALMLDAGSLAKISDWLEEGDFYRRDHQAIYRAVSHLASEGKPCDPVTMMDWFDNNGLAEIVDGGAYIIELANNTSSAANIVAYAEIVREKSKLRTAIETGTQMMESAWKPGSQAGMVVAEAMHSLSQLSVERRGGLEPVKPALQKLLKQMAERFANGDKDKMIGLPTPWHDINELTRGLRDGNLYIIGARPSMGKSIMSGQLAAFTAVRGDRVAWFSVEMTSEECMSRAVAAIGEVPHQFVEYPAQDDPEQDVYWPRITRANELLMDADLIIDDTPSISIRQLKARARRAHLQKPIRLIVIDHMHDMKIDPKQARFDYGEIAQGAKDLAKEFRCPVILVAQLNRNLTNRANPRPVLSDLRESGEIEQKADVVLFVHCDPDTPEAVEIIPAKGRNLKIDGPIYLQKHYDKMRMDDWQGPYPVRNQYAGGSHKLNQSIPA